MIDYKELLEKKITQSINVTKNILNEFKTINNLINTIFSTFDTNKKILICGNGGSAAESQHFAAEIVVRYKSDRIALPAISLNADTSILTASANDFSYEDIFSRQIEALGSRGDLLICFSTSGESTNILKALKTAHKLNINTALFTGKNFQSINNINHIVRVDSVETAFIQEIHLFLIHFICELIDEKYRS